MLGWLMPYIQNTFHSFEYRIANAISRSKWRKIIIIYEEIYVFKMLFLDYLTIHYKIF